MADLILLDIHDFDVILGMDLLFRHHAKRIVIGKRLGSISQGRPRLFYVGYGKYYLPII